MSLRKSFQFVEEFGGLHLPLNQQLFAEAWRKSYSTEPYTGACAGTVCEFLDRFISATRSRHFPNKIPKISPTECVTYQWKYEHSRNPDEFLQAFVSNKLSAINLASTDAEPEFCQHHEDLLSKISFNANNSQILLVNLILNFNYAQHNNIIQDHLICFIKLKSYYLCCDPNNGIAIFSTESSYKNWLQKEIQEGAFAYFVRPIPKSIIAHSSRDQLNARVLAGQLQIKSMRVNNFLFHSSALSPTSKTKFITYPRLTFSPEIRPKKSPGQHPKSSPSVGLKFGGVRSAKL